MGRGAGVKVRCEGNAQRGARVVAGAVRRPLPKLVGAGCCGEVSLQPNDVGHSRRPTSRAKDGIEHELDLAAVRFDPPVAALGPGGRAVAVAQSSADESSASDSAPGAVAGFFFGRPPLPFAA